MKQPLRIAWLMPGGVDRGGVLRVIPHLLWLMDDLTREHALHVVSLYQYDAPCTYALRGATVHDLGSIRESRALDHDPRLALAATLPEARKILATNGPWDLIHGFWAFHAGWLAATLGEELGIPSVISLMGAECADLPGIGYGGQWHDRPRRMVAETTARAACLTVASRYLEKAAKSLGLRPEYLPFGVSVACFQENQAADHPPWRLLHVGSLNRVKNQSMLVAAMRSIVNACPDAHLDILGEDTLNGQLRSQVEYLGLSGNVSLHGYIPNREARAYFQRAHLYLVSSLHEAGPIAMLEAAACGVPTVGTPVGYVHDWKDEMAIAVPHNNAEAMATSVLDILADTARRRRMGTAARNWARRHDSGWTAETLIQLYRSLCAPDHRR